MGQRGLWHSPHVPSLPARVIMLKLRKKLTIIFGMKKFHQYLYGRQFNLITDHKPLTAIFGPKKGVPSLAAARLQRWALLLSAYKYDISYKPSLEHAHADGLSRLPLPTSGSQSDDVAHLFNIGQIQSLPVTVEDVKNATRSDRVFSKVYRYARNGWPGSVPADLQSFKSKQDEIGLEGGCLVGNSSHHSCQTSISRSTISTHGIPRNYSDESNCTQLLLVEWPR